MALETLAGRNMIDGFGVTHMEVGDGLRSAIYKDEFFATLSGQNHVAIDHTDNSIYFRIQDGPIGEKGINGCQVDTIIETALLIIRGLNQKFPCRENSLTITKLEEALHWSRARKKDRIERGVEGKNKE